MTTLLRVLREDRRLTQAAMLDRLERRARELGEGGFSLSARQYERIEHGAVRGSPRPANRRILEAELGRPLEDLLAPADSPILRLQPNTTGAADGVEHLEAVVAHLSALDHQEGAVNVLAPAVAMYSALRDRARVHDGPARDQCLRVAARCAELIGWLHQDSGRPDEARRWTADALDLAESAQAGELRSYILMRRSSVEVDLGDAEAARMLAERALRYGRNAADRSLAYREIAAACALDGDLAGMRRATDTAVDHATGLEARSPLAPYCTIAYLHSEAGASALRLGDARLALDYLTNAAARWDADQPRDRALCLARLALAHARHGQADRAVTTARQAATTARPAGSPRLARTLGQIRPALEEIGAHHWADQLTDTHPPLP